MKDVRFLCSKCGEWHHITPDIGFDAPYYWYTLPEHERARRTVLTPDYCAIDDEDFFIRGVLHIPIIGTERTFGWGLWTSVSRMNYQRYTASETSVDVDGLDAFTGWMSSQISGYPDMLRLKVRAKLRESSQRPVLVLEPTEHPLAVEQRCGITTDRLGRILAPYLHREA